MMNENSVTPSLDGYDVFVISDRRARSTTKRSSRRGSGARLNSSPRPSGATSRLRDLFRAQALCLYHGGIVERSNEPEIGWYDVEAHNDSGIATGPWFEFHFDHCLLPESAQLWATSPRAVQAFVWDENVGVQFHPEIDHVQLSDCSPVESKRPATSVSTWARWSSRRNSKRPRRANARPTSLIFPGAHSELVVRSPRRDRQK